MDSVTRLAFERRQDLLAGQVVQEDAADFQQDHLVGGLDISYSKSCERAVAALVILMLPELRVVYADFERSMPTVPYAAGFLGFREVPQYLQLLSRVPALMMPQVLLVDGFGVLHPLALVHRCSKFRVPEPIRQADIRVSPSFSGRRASRSPAVLSGRVPWLPPNQCRQAPTGQNLAHLQGQPGMTPAADPVACALVAVTAVGGVLFKRARHSRKELHITREKLHTLRLDLISAQESLVDQQQKLIEAEKEMHVTNAQMSALQGEVGSTKSQIETMKRELALSRKMLDATQQELQQSKYELRANEW
ncbi:hypothetical protein WJX73_002665 [Symbiochloris irregularis]|uniref:Endonuclease V n=1 Tax=Symbiochloris irregularis TaxID=706552 RepID=A0AAW1NX30_9CHLO